MSNPKKDRAAGNCLFWMLFMSLGLWLYFGFAQGK